MRKTLMAAVAAGLLASTTACTPDVSEIQRITQQVCGFIPTAVTIASIFPNPYTVPAATVAAAICNAVNQQVPLSKRRLATRRGAQTSVTVNAGGQQFIVQGYFVR